MGAREKGEKGSSLGLILPSDSGARLRISRIVHVRLSSAPASAVSERFPLFEFAVPAAPELGFFLRWGGPAVG